ncbi:MAG TPA: amidase [Casimicrobiaceae bacterium]|jgi:amidase|nr:amidase [Casimicrobiaceae bacterium]
MNECHELDASTAATLLRRGELSSQALVGACLARIDAREREVGAWQFLAREQALAQAREADLREARGALHGVPIAVKDVFDTFDMPTTLGSPIYTHRQPCWDAACVATVRAAGAIPLGKTVTTEFASYHPGKTRNPHDVSRSPGGSSSGSAAAVADFMAPLAFGTQTAASVTRPAAFCGVIGYKATFGELSLSGVRPLAQSLDTLGIFARSIADVALLRDVLLGAQPSPPPVSTTPPRLGVCRTPSWPLADPAMRDALQSAVDTFRRVGATVDEIELPEAFDAVTDAQQTVMTYETARNYVFEMTQRPDGLSASFRAICEAGMRIHRAAYLDAKQRVESARRMLPDAMRECDALITPATRGEAPPIEDGTGDPVMSRMWTALGTPTLAIPVPRRAGSLPLAIQLVARLHADPRLLEVGAWVTGALRQAV